MIRFSPGGRSMTKPGDRVPQTEAEIIRDRAARSGLIKNRKEDFEFLIAARQAGAFGGPSLVSSAHRSLRKSGRRLEWPAALSSRESSSISSPRLG